MDLEKLRGSAEKMGSILRLQTDPIAIRMLRVGEEVPEGLKRPVRDTGQHLSTCQVFAMARRRGVAMAQLLEDMWCVEPALGFGLAEAPEYFLEGNNRYPDSARTREAGRIWAQSLPRLVVGKYVGLASGAAKTATFEPDVIMVYCDSAQVTQLLNVKNWMDGCDVECRLSGHAACVYAVVPTVESGQWQVTAPCGGDRNRALARDDEMIVSFPAGDLEDVVEGLAYFQARGQGLPTAPGMITEYRMWPAYVEIGRQIGMDWVIPK